MFDEAAEKFYNVVDPPSTSSPTLPQAELSSADVARLLKLDLIVPFTGQVGRAQPIRAFSVLEDLKKRRRLIMHPWLWNESADAVKMNLPSQHECIDLAEKYDWAICADIAAFYQHIRLPDPSRFVLNIGGKLFSPTAIPTGAAFCPALAQAIAMAVLTATLDEHRDCKGQAYLDNFRFLANSNMDLTATRTTFLTLCEELRIVLNDVEDIAPVQRYTFLGITYDHVIRSVEPGDKIRNRLQYASHPTLRDIVQLFSRCAWLSHVFRLPLFDYYYIYKFLRRRAGAVLDEPAKPWACLSDLFHRWIHEVSQMRPICVPTRVLNWTLVTDASSSGWGAILYADEVCVAAGPWSTSLLGKDIAVLEMLAVQWGWQRLVAHKVQQDVRIHLVIDNTTVINVLKNGRSRGFLLNAIARSMPQFASVRYVTSKDNTADGLSRFFSIKRSKAFPFPGTTAPELPRPSPSLSSDHGYGLDFLHPNKSNLRRQ